MEDLFIAAQAHLDAEQESREEVRVIVKSFEGILRRMQVALEKIHSQGADVPAICAKIRSLFGEAAESYAKLDTLVEAEMYYRYHDHWKNSDQGFTSVASFLIFLETKALVTMDQVKELLGGARIELDDFLIGLTDLPKELSRLCVNSVTAGDYELPRQIQKFVAELYAGFKLLNLKNDFLRKRFDGIKYDVKKIEEIVYDLSIRVLQGKQEASK